MYEIANILSANARELLQSNKTSYQEKYKYKMIHTLRKLKHIIIIYLVLYLTSACSSTLDNQWIRTNNDVLLWISSSNTAKSYIWQGEVIDSIAYGNGILSVFDAEGKKTDSNVNMFYGAFSPDDIITMDDGSRYVGTLVNDKMEGFGVLVKSNEIYIGTFHESKPNGFLKLYRNGKLYYEGDWKDGAFNGEGTLYKEDGSIKTGNWIEGRLSQTLVDEQLPQGHYYGYTKDGKPDGLGKMNYTNGTSYQGKWKTGFWEGEGLYISANDSVYGIWEKGKICGDVIYRTPQLYFEGTFVDNIPVGIGNLVQSDGSYYSGFWLDGKREGNGDMMFPNGDSYTGEWSNNEFNGFGVYEYAAAKAVYQGEWSGGLQNGNGFYKSPQFSYNGQWEKGWMDGDGVLTFSNGDRYEGTVHENIIDGIGSYNFANGNWYEGEFVNGKMNGLGVFQFKKGDRFEGEFYDGKIYGDGTMYLVGDKGTVSITGFWPKDGSFPKEASILFENGDLYEGPLNNGAPTQEGTWISGEERQQKLDKVNSSALHKANEFYKKHRETINWCLTGVSAVVTAVEVASASTVIGAPIAALAHSVNVAINVVDASMAIASAGIDVMENNQLGADNTNAIQNLTTEVSLNAAFVLVPKVAKVAVKPLKAGVKYVILSPIAEQILKGGKSLIKKSSLRFIKGKVNGKTIRLSIAEKGRKIEKTLVSSKVTQKPMIALGRLLTQFKNQVVSHSSYLKQLNVNPKLKEQLVLSAEGSSKNLGDNMRLLGTDKWVKKSERIRRYLGMPKRQVEPHHVIPSNPVTETGRKAREIWVKYFNSVDHPCNGIWLGRDNKKLGYKALAKGSNHSPNSVEYEQKVSAALLNTYKKYQKQYANNPEMMQQKLAETVDNLKKQLYKGELHIGSNSHTVHTVWSIFKNRNNSGIISNAAQNIMTPILNLTTR